MYSKTTNINHKASIHFFSLFVIISVFIFSPLQIQSQTIGEIYNYNIGDVFHERRDTYSNYGPPSFEKTVVTDKYFSYLLDTVFYVTDDYSWVPQSCISCTDEYFSSSKDNIRFYTNLEESIIGGLKLGKGRPTNYECIDTNIFTGVWIDTISSFSCKKIIISFESPSSPLIQIDTCLSYQFEGTSISASFGVGLGRIHYNYEGQFWSDLVYYEKGNDTCGTPVWGFQTSLHELPKNNNIVKIYPNPTKKYFTIDIDSFSKSGKYNLSIYDLSGKNIYSKELIQNITTINDFDNKGFFIWTVDNEDGLISRGKLVKE